MSSLCYAPNNPHFDYRYNVGCNKTANVSGGNALKLACGDTHVIWFLDEQGCCRLFNNIDHYVLNRFTNRLNYKNVIKYKKRIELLLFLIYVYFILVILDIILFTCIYFNIVNLVEKNPWSQRYFLLS